MAVSKDRIRFTLSSRYFQVHKTSNGMARNTCAVILRRAFGLPDGCENYWARYMGQHPGGFDILCRPSQFARFIVYRYDANECINGVRDLEPKIVKPFVQKLLSEVVADDTDLHRSDVLRVLSSLGLEDHVTTCKDENVVDVAGNFHNG